MFGGGGGALRSGGDGGGSDMQSGGVEPMLGANKVRVSPFRHLLPEAEGAEALPLRVP